MSFKFYILAILAGLLAILFSPQIASETMLQGCLVKSPPNFTKDKAFDFDFIKGIQIPNVHGPLDALLFARNGHKMSAALTKKGDRIEMQNSGPDRTAKVKVHTDSQFVYREDYSYGQRVVHTMTFTKATVLDYKTKFEYEVKWKGSYAQMLLGRSGFAKPVGVKVGSIEEFRLAIEDAYEEEKTNWGTARYE